MFDSVFSLKTRFSQYFLFKFILGMLIKHGQCLLSCAVPLLKVLKNEENAISPEWLNSVSLPLSSCYYRDLLYKIILFLADEWCYGIWIAMGVFCQSRHLWVIFRTKSCSWCIERVSIHLFHHEGRVLNSVAMNTQVVFIQVRLELPWFFF